MANDVEFRLDCTRYWEAFDDLVRVEHTTFEACIKERSMVEACTTAQYDADETRCYLTEEGFDDSRGFHRTGVAVKIVPK